MTASVSLIGSMLVSIQEYLKLLCKESFLGGITIFNGTLLEYTADLTEEEEAQAEFIMRAYSNNQRYHL